MKILIEFSPTERYQQRLPDNNGALFQIFYSFTIRISLSVVLTTVDNDALHNPITGKGIKLK